ncbi:MAG: phenylalanine--tRNA ligase subunit alpha [Thermaurantimonas sp.]|uniref:Phenylalanine--tRNA ligase alpha subunit n=1 Tax=Thermaurantimonas aggregans TaxID=2173829 RepID=A0A401XMJ0_9FLAO|nr:phenylalanine--tRNA ligase subunit alpha [Thermaurantimonas aggregans]MCX8148420.1 phenylalanine--tRNA ligase subunit alpha [Thermaurantimonas aggregans]GCD78224.1 phenylalanine--tRNA ligase alpha subunit [Thermaurantimonas aggregans]
MLSLPYIQELSQEISAALLSTPEEVEAFRLKYLSKKGIIPSLFDEFKTIGGAEKKTYGKPLNELKKLAEEKFQSAKSTLENKNLTTSSNCDFTRPAHLLSVGSRHPVSMVIEEMIEIFSRIGFTVLDGPEIEDDWHNFTALNFPPDHPARDMQDTFFISKNPDMALRTHTSNVQVRAMETMKPPIRVLAPGRVYRNEAISARSHCFFHQIEGLYIDKNVSFADLKQTLLYFTESFFGKSKIRMRPSYFPFTEPSAEVDVYWGLENEVDYRITKGTGWLEILGCGMVDPNVLQACGIDPNEYSGFAFGIGIERIAMNRYQIPDIRMLSENDVRFLRQF